MPTIIPSSTIWITVQLSIFGGMAYFEGDYIYKSSPFCLAHCWKMPLFSRRTVQRWLNELVDTISSNDLGRITATLNRGGIQALDNEWELAVIRGLRNFGTISYEEGSRGSSRPDVLFEMTDRPHATFLADITTVSDRGLENENPVELFRRELATLVRKQGLKPEHFIDHIQGARVGPFGNGKMRLNLPSRKEIPSFLKTRLSTFLDEIVKRNLTHHSIAIKEGGIEFAIRYDRNAHFAGGGHVTYSLPYSPTKNPLSNKLREKAKQLNRSAFNGPKGIIICDANSRVLKSSIYSAHTYSDRDIIFPFLRKNTSINFVMTIWVRWPRNNIIIQGVPLEHGKQLEGKVFINPDARHSLPVEVEKILERFLSTLPQPVDDALNASNRISKRRTNVGLSLLGGWSMEDNTIKIPSRALTELLAGQLDQKKFFKISGFRARDADDKTGCWNQFDRMLSEGRLIKNLSVEKCKDDDDWIVFEYGDPDPALSPLVVPNAGTPSS